MTERPVMVTGPRAIAHPEDVSRGLAEAYRLAGATLAVTGGAEGADTLAARAAVREGLSFDVYLPNRAYRFKYERAIPQALLDHAHDVRYVVEREVGADWERWWGAEKWWLDNFTRNSAMVEAACDAIVVLAGHPRELLAPEASGGAAHATKALFKAGFAEVWWAPDVKGGEVVRAALAAQPSLFG